MEHASRRGPRHQPESDGTHDRASEAPGRAYARFAGALAASGGLMYFLAFSQIDLLGHFHFSLSVLWISLSMVSVMGLIMLIAMRGMLPNRRLNAALFALFALLLAGAFAAGRVEALVGDDAFLRSMIPHHSRAIHMCQEAALTDTEVIQLCGQIIESQQREIAQMEDIIARRG